MEKLILLKRIKPEEYEVHKNEIKQSNNLLFSTKDEKFAKKIVDGFNNPSFKQKDFLIAFSNYWKKSNHQNIDEAISGFLKTKYCKNGTKHEL